MADVAALTIKIDSDGVRMSRTRLADLERQGRRTERGITTATGRMRNNFRALERSVFGLHGAFAALGGGLIAREMMQSINLYQRLEGQLGLVTDSATQLAQAEKDLYAVAQDTYSAYAGTVELYSKLARNSEQLGASQEQLIGFTSAVNQAMQISGASAQQASAGILQLSQALGSGELRGDELRSVMENTPRLAEAIAAGLGTTIGGMRDLAEQGELTASRVMGALLEQADEIDREFDRMPRRVDQAMVQLRNDIERTFKDTDTEPLIGALDELRETVTDPGVAAGLQSLATNTVTATSALARMAGKAGEVIAGLRIMTGFGGGNELVDLSDKIGRLTDELDRLEDGGGRGLEFIGKGFASTFGERTQSAIADVREELRKTRAEYENLLSGGQSVSDAMAGLNKYGIAQGNEPFSLLDPDRPMIFPREGTPRNKPSASQRLHDEPSSPARLTMAEEEIQRLQEAVALYGDLTRAEEMRIRLSRGYLGNVTQQQAQQLIGLEQELDMRDRLAEAREAEVQRTKDLIRLEAERQDRVAGLQRSLATPEQRSIMDFEARLAEIDKYVQDDALRTQLISQNWARLTDEISDETDRMSVFATRAGENIQDQLGRTVSQTLRGEFDGILDSWSNMILDMVAQAQAAQLAHALMGDSFAEDGKFGGLIGAGITAIGGMLGGGVSSASAGQSLADAGIGGSSFGIQSMFGGGRATGGPVSSGMLYEVNERGPELFSSGGRDYLMMGSQSGQVTPSAPAISGPGQPQSAPNVSVSIDIAPGLEAVQTKQQQSPNGDMDIGFIVRAVENNFLRDLETRGKQSRGLKRTFPQLQHSGS